MNKPNLKIEDNLKSAMERLNVTTKELSGFTRMDETMICEWIDGKFPDNPCLVVSISAALGCTVDYILGTSPEDDLADTGITLYLTLQELLEKVIAKKEGNGMTEEKQEHPENVNGYIQRICAVVDENQDLMEYLPAIRLDRIQRLAADAGVDLPNSFEVAATCDYFGQDVYDYDRVYLPDRRNGYVVYSGEWYFCGKNNESGDWELISLHDIEAEFPKHAQEGYCVVICREDTEENELEEFFNM